MSYLLDTNVVSELLRPVPDKNVVEWFGVIPNESLFLSVLTLGEIRRGVEKLATGKRKTQLIVWLEHDLSRWFDGRILPVDQHVADRWGYLTASAKRPLPAIDSLLAATALTHNLKMVSRNVDDFDMPGLEVVNPFIG
jgi:predicted nucleic acid-binding protein